MRHAPCNRRRPSSHGNALRLNTLLALITVPPRSSRLAKSLSSVAKLLEGSGTNAWTWDSTRRAFSPQPINDFAPVLGLRIRDTWDLAMRRISKEFQQPCMEGQIAVVTDATVGVGWPSTGILRRMLEQGNLVRLPRLRFHKLGRGN
ncbi:hypothetical protein JB92DRAFT_2837827 [Gautieria morchelliformis]|nr:hypothetical protein JB92DRAFT_2837827 [Gautieria morchelliformis]